MDPVETLFSVVLVVELMAQTIKFGIPDMAKVNSSN